MCVGRGGVEGWRRGCVWPARGWPTCIDTSPAQDRPAVVQRRSGNGRPASQASPVINNSSGSGGLGSELCWLAGWLVVVVVLAFPRVQCSAVQPSPASFPPVSHFCLLRSIGKRRHAGGTGHGGGASGEWRGRAASSRTGTLAGPRGDARYFFPRLAEPLCTLTTTTLAASRSATGGGRGERGAADGERREGGQQQTGGGASRLTASPDCAAQRNAGWRGQSG